VREGTPLRLGGWRSSCARHLELALLEPQLARELRIVPRKDSALAPTSDSPIGLDPSRLGSLDERSEAANLSHISFESGRVDLPLKREVLLMEGDLSARGS
jgi:hypothetical protein